MEISKSPDGNNEDSNQQRQPNIFIFTSLLPLMPQVLLATRNVVVYDGTNNAVVGGCRQFGTTSIAEFFFCLRMFIVNPTDFQLYHEETNNYVAENDAEIIQTGKYYVCSTSMIDFLQSLTVCSSTRGLLGGDLNCRTGSPSQHLWRESC